MSTFSYIPNEKPLIVEEAIRHEVSLPVGHYLHPHDPSGRTALCGQEILGVETFGEFRLCPDCEFLHWVRDWAPLPRSG